MRGERKAWGLYFCASWCKIKVIFPTMSLPWITADIENSYSAEGSL